MRGNFIMASDKGKISRGQSLNDRARTRISRIITIVLRHYTVICRICSVIYVVDSSDEVFPIEKRVNVILQRLHATNFSGFQLHILILHKYLCMGVFHLEILRVHLNSPDLM